MQACAGCSWWLTTDDDRARRLCARCAAKLGIPAVAPSRRPEVPCRRCDHPELIRARLRERMGDESYRPLAIAYAVHRHEPAVNDDAQRYGALVAYVCRACGFTEMYADRPEDIPIGPEFGTELVRASGGGPYR